MSPYFIEDYKNMKPSWIRWWKQEFNNTYSFKKSPEVSVPEVYIIAGSKEPEPVLICARSVKRTIKNSKLIIADRAKHDISQKEYLQTLEELIKTF